MLIISRKRGESFLIGDDIEVFILDLQNDKIKVGIDAPLPITVIRKELKEISEANLDAAKSLKGLDYSALNKLIKRDI